jgi:hypothetical protein
MLYSFVQYPLILKSARGFGWWRAREERRAKSRCMLTKKQLYVVMNIYFPEELFCIVGQECERGSLDGKLFSM